MSDKKISELTNITGANLADADEFVVVDTSASETKAITWAELKEGLDTGTGFVRITGDTMTGDLSFGDNDKAIFGAGSDLQIYHNTALPGSVIEDVGSGDLIIKASNQIRFQDGSSNHYAIFNEGSSVDLYHNNALKLATTSTGVDVTGTVTADSGYFQGSNSFINDTMTLNFAAPNGQIAVKNSSGSPAANMYLYTTDTSGNTNLRQSIGYNGDISFYEDTGTTPKFFWDASAEALGIGTSSPSAKLEVEDSIDAPLRISIDNNSSTSSATAELVVSASGNTFNLINYPDADTSNANRTDFFSPADGSYFTFSPNNAERMRIDASGNLLVGTTDTSLYNNTSGGGFHASANGFTEVAYESANAADPAFLVNNTGADGDIIQLRKDGAPVGSIGNSGGDVYIGTGVSGLLFLDGDPSITPHNTSANTANDNAIDIGRSSRRFKDLYLSGGLRGDITFKNNAGTTEYARFDASGNLLVGTTSAYSVSKTTIDYSSNGAFGITLRDTGTATDGAMAYFVKGGAVVGSIISTTSATLYNISSDYRLKEDVQPMTGASDRVLDLNPVNFAWKVDGSRTDGFLAHEAQAVAPYAVTGEKDGEEMQSIDHSKLVPLLTAALQEALGRIETLEAEVAALKA